MKILDNEHGTRSHRMMRGCFAARGFVGGAFALASLFASACGGQTQPAEKGPPTAQQTYGVITPDPPPPAQNPTDDRMTAHDGVTLPTMHLRIVYVGMPGFDQAPSMDVFAKWLLTSDYWGTLSQYGVQNGVVMDSLMMPTESFVPTTLLEPGKPLVAVQDLDMRIRVLINGDDSNDPYPGLAGADAYAFYLPDGLNVSLGHRNDYETQTCVDAGGYHAHDGSEPYAILPPCDLGRSTEALAHELAETATDPISGGGWLSDGDESKNGGEVCDLCNHAATVEGWTVSQMWSNADGECVPYEK